MGYIRVPIETNPETLAQSIFAYIQSQAPGWTPNDGNLDTWIIRAMAAKAAENRDLASDVPDDIFGTLGASLFAIPPIDSVAATADTTWTLIDTIGHTIKAGTFVGIRNGNGDLITFQTVAAVTVTPGSSITAAGEVVIRAVDTGTDANALSGTVELIDVLDWVSSITLVAPTAGGTDPETNDVYLARLSRRLQRLSTVPILSADFALAALDADPGVFRAVGIDLYNPLHNLLSANDASFETSVAGYTGANATLAQSATFAASGSNSMRLTAASAADMSASLNTADAVPVTPGQTITAIGSFRSAVTGRTIKLGLAWYTSGNALIGSVVYGATGADTTAGFTQVSVSAVAPPTAAKVGIVPYVVAPANAEVHYFDKASIRHGTGTDWVAGGTPETGNIRTETVVAVTSSGTPVSSGIKTNIVNFIAARRESNWIINVMDARYTNIDVAASIKVLSGFDPTSTQTAVIAALTNYLSPANWALDPNTQGTDALTTWVDAPTIYYNELIALVSAVSGVDRVADLTVNIHGNTPARVDVPIDSPAGLTTVGTITAPVV